MKLLKNERMGSYEKENNKASYRTLVEYFIGDIVLCNNIVNIDDSIWDNLEVTETYYNENGEEISFDEYMEDDNAYTERNDDFYQFYLCNVSEYERKKAIEAGLVLSYSDKLDCDVLCVSHWGTSWDYVLTSVELVDTYEELSD